ncbi:MAG: hypothetical protein IKS94_03050 [Prevotella sp.]|nr:hypothetical protein [Prevotella sp.]
MDYKFNSTNRNIELMRKCCILLMMIAATGCLAQKDSVNQLSFSMDVLTHGEACGGGLPKTEGGSDEDKSRFMVGRVRLNVDYQRSGLQVHAVIQNKAIWGMEGNNALTLYEGWVKMAAKNGLFAQMGRIALAYDDERIIGPNDFATAAQSHDVLRLGYEGNGHKAHAILAYNQNGDNCYNGTYYDGGAQLYKTMQTVWYHYDVREFPLGASLLFMNIGQQAGCYVEVDDEWGGKKKAPEEYNEPRTEYQQMYGGYINFHPKHLTLEGSYYRQTGKVVNNLKQARKIKAWMVSAKATVKPTENYGFVLGYDYLSGDEYVPVIHGGSLGMPLQEYEGGFAPLYGSRTKFYGILDYFYESAYINGFTPGLQNAYLGITGKPASKLSCSATYHYLATATELYDLDRTLGHSIELQASYKFSKDISLVAGYTQMHGTETMDRLKQGSGSKQARWGWFSLVISPSLFTTKF